MQHNPYQPPAQGHAYDPYRAGYPQGAAPSSRGAMLVWVKAAFAAMGIFGMPAGFIVSTLAAHDEIFAMLGVLMLVGGYFAMFASMIISLVWVYTMWDSLPYELRANYKRVHSPTSSALYLLIPYFNLYWMFVVSIDLIRAINIGAERTNTRRVPEAWGIVCPIMQLLPCPNIVIAPITWTIMMFQVQRAKDELVNALYRQMGTQQQF